MIPALIVIGAAVVVGWGAMLLFGLGAMAVVGFGAMATTGAGVCVFVVEKEQVCSHYSLRIRVFRKRNLPG
jgi:hypothetical protein